MNANEIVATMEQLYPDARCALNHETPFQLLVATVLSAQTTDAAVNKVTPALFQAYPSAKEMAQASPSEIEPYIQRIGLYRNKARSIVHLSIELENRFDGVVPSSHKDLESLPGVGRKTANVILNTAFRQPTMAVDTHIFRVSNRTGLAPGATPLVVEKQLLRRVPEPYRVHAHHWLILLGRYICQARKPRCYECPVASNCHFTPKTPAP